VLDGLDCMYVCGARADLRAYIRSAFHLCDAAMLPVRAHVRTAGRSISASGAHPPIGVGRCNITQHHPP
jgi:hypothetical protein